MTTTLLAVDDSVTMRKVLEITFAGENFKTVLASSGQEAISLIKSERPTLALLDHTLPDMSGYDLCRELKAAAPGCAVMILSSKQSPYDKARGSATGVDDFMDKPFDTQKLLDKVSQVLSQPRAAAPAPQAVAAPVASAPAAAARPRSPTLSYGTPSAPAAAPAAAAAASSAKTTLPGGVPAATPKPGVAAAGPRLAATAAAPAPAPAPAAPAKVAAAAPIAAAATAAAHASNGLNGKLEALGLTPAQVDAVLALSREVVERVVWEVVPVLAETMIKEELRRLTSE